jgi:hypothetical protein
MKGKLIWLCQTETIGEERVTNAVFFMPDESPGKKLITAKVRQSNYSKKRLEELLNQVFEIELTEHKDDIGDHLYYSLNALLKIQYKTVGA